MCIWYLLIQQVLKSVLCTIRNRWLLDFFPYLSCPAHVLTGRIVFEVPYGITLKRPSSAWQEYSTSRTWDSCVSCWFLTEFYLSLLLVRICKPERWWAFCLSLRLPCRQLGWPTVLFYLGWGSLLGCGLSVLKLGEFWVNQVVSHSKDL